MPGVSGWPYLLLGGAMEIAWAVATKARPWWAARLASLALVTFGLVGIGLSSR